MLASLGPARPHTSIAVSVCAGLMVVVANLIGFRDLFFGAFSWQAAQPEFSHGILELAAFAALLLPVIRFCRTLRALVLLVAAVCWPYLRLHAVDFAALVAGLYALGILSVGVLVDRTLFRGMVWSSTIYLGACFAIGLTALGLLLLLCSLIFGSSFESVQLLAWAPCLAALVLLALQLRGRPILPPGRPWRCGWLKATAWTLLIVVCLAVMARSNVVVFYDSIWYGMRPDRVLFGPTGFYDFLGLTTQVHYYPKFYELIIAPLQGWGDHSIAIGFGVVSLLLFVSSVYALARAVDVHPDVALTLAVAMACVPAAAGSAETTKGDLLASACVLLSLVALLRAYRGEGFWYIAACVMFALMATTLRLSALPWLALLFVMFVPISGWQLLFARRSPAVHCAALDWRWLWLVAGVLLLSSLVHYRTLLLTGTPIITNASTQERLAALGFELFFPIGGLTGNDAPDGLRKVLGYFHELALSPSVYRFHVFKWTGASWLALLPFAVLSPLSRSWRERGVLLAIAVMGVGFPLLLAYNSWPVRGGDGNYFLVPVVCLCVLGIAGARSRAWMGWSLVVSAALALVVYVAGANWVGGTSRFTGDLARGVLDENVQMDAYLAEGGLQGLRDALRACPRETRVIGLMPQASSFALPVRFEPLQELRWNNSAALASTDGIRHLFDATYTQLVILPAPGHLAEVDPLLDDTDQAAYAQEFQRLSNAELGREMLVEGVLVDSYVIYRVAGARLDGDCLAGMRRASTGSI